MLGDILVQRGAITAAQLDAALNRQQSSGALLGTVLREMGLVSDEDIARALAHESGLPFVRLEVREPDAGAVALVPEAFARRSALAPLQLAADVLRVAQANPFDVLALDELQRLCGHVIEPHAATPADVAAFLDRCYGPLAARPVRQPPMPAAPLGRAPDAPLQQVFEHALGAGSRILHIDRTPGGARARLRIADRLVPDESLSALVTDRAINDLEMRASLRAGEGMSDGLFEMIAGGARHRVRVSRTAGPARNSYTVRLDPILGHPPALDALGFSRRNLAIVRDEMRRRGSIALVAGPPASGRTTTLQTLGRALADTPMIVGALADWADYDGPIHLVGRAAALEAGRVFSSLDLDALIVDPVDDPASAAAALAAACAGLSVMAAVPACTADRALALLGGFGIAREAIAPVAGLLITQRLLRRVCVECRKPATYSADTLSRVGLTGGPDLTLSRGAGCDRCRGTGFEGWTGVFEVIPGAVVARAIDEHRPVAATARAHGVKTLADEAMVRVIFGDVALDEILADSGLVEARQSR